MLWIGLIILVIAAAYFLYKNHRTGRLSLDQNKTLESSQTANPADDSNDQKNLEPSVSTKNRSAQTDLSGQTKTAPHDGPSLLYADRTSTTESEQSASTSSLSENQMTRAENLPIDDSVSASDPMDFTAETATLSSDDVGLPANSSEYEQSNNNKKPLAATQTDLSISQGTIAANAQIHELESKHPHHAEQVDQPSNKNQGINAGQAAVTIGAAAVGIAGTVKASASDNAASDAHSSTMAHPTGEAIDLELGDNTLNDSHENVGLELEDENDELLDFGDLTADISEMLKELNLRESDSPRLEINEEEYQQLKSGDPGEVKPAKIENVAGKLRNMLQ